ncbi:MAG: FAD-binding oxidoreductase [Candidatus Levyibacteriota bacterium]
MKIAAKKFTVSFVKKEQLTADIAILYFAKPESFLFLPGHYLQMTLPHNLADERGSNRFFTISSAPEEEYIMITTRKGKSTFKQKLFQLEIGSEIMCFGPLGTFVLYEAPLRI